MWRPTGGQSVPNFDYYMGPGVAKTFIKELYKVMSIKYPQCSDLRDKPITSGNLTNEGIRDELKKWRTEDKNGLILHRLGDIEKLITEKYSKTLQRIEINELFDIAMKYTEDATHQAMEAVVHNLNSMHSRAGRI